MRTRGEAVLDFITGHSQQSDIDLFSKLETNFLEKFFKYNLTDYFYDHLSNHYQDVLDRKVLVKGEKLLASSLFVVNRRVSVKGLESKLDCFYRSRSKSFEEGHLDVAFKKLYCNQDEKSDNSEVILNPDQLVLVDIKIKAEVQKIQEVPQKILKYLSAFKKGKKDNLTQIEELFTNYRQPFFNLFFVYFGDINFGVMDRSKYQVDTIQLMGKSHKLRIFTFYISKQSLIQTFRHLNKIQTLQIINDLVIQFYELKRAKQRQKRSKAKRELKQELNSCSITDRLGIGAVNLNMVVGVLSLTIFGITIKIMFF